MSLYILREVPPKIHHELHDFMSTECLEALKSAPQDKDRLKGKK